jgi:predicted O-methyltransferase YrrM
MMTLYGADIWTGFVPSGEPDPQGWNGDHLSLARLASLPGKKLVVDVGVWKGQSTINMALAMKNAGIDGCILAVDTYLGSPEHWDMELFRRTHGMPNLYQIFLSNVYRAGVSDLIVPMAQTSATAAKIFRAKNIIPSVVHIDAAHEYEDVLRDAEDYYSILQPGGFLIGDDYHATWPGVVKGANEFAANHTLPLAIETPKWIVQKPA